MGNRRPDAALLLLQFAGDDHPELAHDDALPLERRPELVEMCNDPFLRLLVRGLNDSPKNAAAKGQLNHDLAQGVGMEREVKTRDPFRTEAGGGLDDPVEGHRGASGKGPRGPGRSKVDERALPLSSGSDRRLRFLG